MTEQTDTAAPAQQPGQTQQQKMADIDLLLDPRLAPEKPVVKKATKQAKEKLRAADDSEHEDNTDIDDPPSRRDDATQGDDVVGDGAEQDGDGKLLVDPTEAELAEQAVEKQRKIALYAETVGMPGGHEPTTVGELKNEVLEYRQKNDEYVERDNKLQLQYQQIMAISDTLPELTQQQVELISQANATVRQRENKLLINAIPDWSNERTFISDKQHMLETLGSYGVSEADLDSVSDHRIIKLAYDYDRLKRRVAKASETNQSAMAETTKRKTMSVKKPGNKKPADTKPVIKRDNLGGNLSTQMGEIDALLTSEKIR